MTEPLAAYRYEWDAPTDWAGWRYELRLYPDRLVGAGVRGPEEAEHTNRLAEYHPDPDRSRGLQQADRPGVGAAAAGLVAAAAAVLLWQPVADGLVPLKLVGIGAGVVGGGVMVAVSKLAGRRRRWAKAVFAHRPGTDPMTIWCPDARFEPEWEDFVGRLQQAVAAAARQPVSAISPGASCGSGCTASVRPPAAVCRRVTRPARRRSLPLP